MGATQNLIQNKLNGLLSFTLNVDFYHYSHYPVCNLLKICCNFPEEDEVLQELKGNLLL